MTDSQLRTANETAHSLRVKPGTLGAWRLNKRHRLPYLKIGRLVRYRAHDIEEFLNARLVGVAS